MKARVILFYSPFNQRSRDTESVMVALGRQGHRVISLSQSTGAQIHEYLQTQGVETYTHVLKNQPGWIFYLKQAWFLIKFCREHKVEFIYSHLESANLVAVLSQPFIRAKVYVVRHHIVEARELGFDRSLSYRLTYRWAKHILVVSAQAKQYMVDHEGIAATRITHINLGYDFSLYEPPRPEFVQGLRQKHPWRVTLIAAGRFTTPKRMDLAIEVLNRLRREGVDAGLFMLGKGDQEEPLRQHVRDLGLESFVVFPGYVSNLLDYFAASQFLIHPSIAESSCVVVKEASLVGLPVVVCRGVGDFDSYMDNGVNGIVVDPAKFVDETVSAVRNFSNHDTTAMAQSLRERVKNLFSIEAVIEKYNTIHEQ